VAAIASKALKEVKYHAAHSAQWVIRLGDGTEESHQRIQQSLDDLWAYTGEFFMDDEVSAAGAKMGLSRLNGDLQSTWSDRIQSIMEQATLRIPDTTWMHKGGRQGKHTEHLSYMLAEMQVLQRTYPGAQW